MEREQIITLIREDLNHNKLLNGLDNIGLTDNGAYTLKLDFLVAELLGYEKGLIPDDFLFIYQSTMLSVPQNATADELQNLAENLYHRLSTLRTT